MVNSYVTVKVANTSQNACHRAGPGDRAAKAVDPVQLFFRSRLFGFINKYKNDSPANLLALSNGKWKVPIEKMDEFLNIYLAEYESVPFGLVFLKSPVFPYPMDLDHLEDANSVGPPLIVVKIVLETLAEVLVISQSSSNTLTSSSAWNVVSMHTSIASSSTRKRRSDSIVHMSQR